MLTTSTIHDVHPQLRLRYALLKGTTEGLHFVDDVPNGKQCNCICSHCGKELIARNNPKNKREHHFAHASGKKCEGARMTTLHKLSQQILKEEKKVMLPAYKKQYVVKDAKLRTFEEVELEAVCKNEDINRRPDCIGYNEGKTQSLWIEVFCRHRIDAIKREEIIQNKQYCIEINFSDLLNTDYTEASVRERLLTSFEDREWICHPEWDEEESKREKEERMRQEELARKNQEEARIEKEEAEREIQRKYKESLRKFDEAKQKQQEKMAQDGDKESHKAKNVSIEELSYNENRDWVMFAKQMYGNDGGRKSFYDTITMEYTRVTLNNSKRLVAEEACRKINDLLPRTDCIELPNKIYLELLLAIWILDKLNRSEGHDLSRLLVVNQTLRNNVYRTIKRIGSVNKQSISEAIIPAGLENREEILRILRICYE